MFKMLSIHKVKGRQILQDRGLGVRVNKIYYSNQYLDKFLICVSLTCPEHTVPQQTDPQMMRSPGKIWLLGTAACISVGVITLHLS